MLGVAGLRPRSTCHPPQAEDVNPPSTGYVYLWLSLVRDRRQQQYFSCNLCSESYLTAETLTMASLPWAVSRIRFQLTLDSSTYSELKIPDSRVNDGGMYSLTKVSHVNKLLILPTQPLSKLLPRSWIAVLYLFLKWLCSWFLSFDPQIADGCLCKKLRYTRLTPIVHHKGVAHLLSDIVMTGPCSKESCAVFPERNNVKRCVCST